MGTYATAAELRDDPAVPDDLTDEAAEALLVKAERKVDRLVGPRFVDDATGRKWAPANLTGRQAANLRDATIVLAVALNANPDAFTLPTVGSTKGPDFEQNVPPQGRELPAAGAILEARDLLDAVGLRVTGAVARP